MLLPLWFLWGCARPAPDSEATDTSEPPDWVWQTYDECNDLDLGDVVDGAEMTWMGSGDPVRRGALVVMRSDEDVHAYADGTYIDYGDVVVQGIDFATEQIVAYDWRNTDLHGRFIQEFRWITPNSTMAAVINVDDPCGDEDQLDMVMVWMTPIADVVSTCMDGRECTGRAE